MTTPCRRRRRPLPTPVAGSHRSPPLCSPPTPSSLPMASSPEQTQDGILCDDFSDSESEGELSPTTPPSQRPLSPLAEPFFPDRDKDQRSPPPSSGSACLLRSYREVVAHGKGKEQVPQPEPRSPPPAPEPEERAACRSSQRANRQPRHCRQQQRPPAPAHQHNQRRPNVRSVVISGALPFLPTQEDAGCHHRASRRQPDYPPQLSPVELAEGWQLV